MSPAQVQDLGLELNVVHVEHISGDDRLAIPAEPAKGDGARGAELGEDIQIA